MDYVVNKGVGRPLDFYGLKEQFILYFAAGIVVAVAIYFVLAFISQFIAVTVAALVAVADYFLCYYLNAKYGVCGMSKSFAMRSCPERIMIRRVRNLMSIGQV